MPFSKISTMHLWGFWNLIRKGELSNKWSQRCSKKCFLESNFKILSLHLQHAYLPYLLYLNTIYCYCQNLIRHWQIIIFQIRFEVFNSNSKQLSFFFNIHAVVPKGLDSCDCSDVRLDFLMLLDRFEIRQPLPYDLHLSPYQIFELGINIQRGINLYELFQTVPSTPASRNNDLPLGFLYQIDENIPNLLKPRSWDWDFMWKSGKETKFGDIARAGRENLSTLLSCSSKNTRIILRSRWAMQRTFLPRMQEKYWDPKPPKSVSRGACDKPKDLQPMIYYYYGFTTTWLSCPTVSWNGSTQNICSF